MDRRNVSSKQTFNLKAPHLHFLFFHFLSVFFNVNKLFNSCEIQSSNSTFMTWIVSLMQCSVFLTGNTKGTVAKHAYRSTLHSLGTADTQDTQPGWLFLSGCSWLGQFWCGSGDDPGQLTCRWSKASRRADDLEGHGTQWHCCICAPHHTMVVAFLHCGAVGRICLWLSGITWCSLACPPCPTKNFVSQGWRKHMKWDGWYPIPEGKNVLTDRAVLHKTIINREKSLPAPPQYQAITLLCLPPHQHLTLSPSYPVGFGYYYTSQASLKMQNLGFVLC